MIYAVYERVGGGMGKGNADEHTYRKEVHTSEAGPRVGGLRGKAD